MTSSALCYLHEWTAAISCLPLNGSIIIRANSVIRTHHPPGADCIAYLIWCFFDGKVSSSFDKNRTTPREHLFKSAIKARLDSIIHLAVYKENKQVSEIFQSLLGELGGASILLLF